MVKIGVISLPLVFVLGGLMVATSLPITDRTSPVYYVEVQPVDNFRATRSAGNSIYGEGKTPGGISYVKSDFYRKIRGARLHVADGAYPVYYTPGIANGRFGAKIFTLT